MKREIPLRNAHRLLAGRPVCLLTSRYRGQNNVMALSWTCPISIEPPLVALAIHPSRYTHGLIERGQELTLNIPARPLGDQVVQCGTSSGGDVDKLQQFGLTVSAGRRVEAVWIEECLAHLECAVVDRIAPGDHSVFVAEIVGAWAEQEAFTEHWEIQGQPEDLLPLMHLGGTEFALWGAEISLP